MASYLLSLLFDMGLGIIIFLSRTNEPVHHGRSNYQIGLITYEHCHDPGIFSNSPDASYLFLQIQNWPFGGA